MWWSNPLGYVLVVYLMYKAYQMVWITRKQKKGEWLWFFGDSETITPVCCSGSISCVRIWPRRSMAESSSPLDLKATQR